MPNTQKKSAYESSSKQLLIEEAKKLLNNSIHLDGETIGDLIANLVKQDQFGYAIEVIIKNYGLGKIPDKEKQRFAKYIYKDHSVPSTIRFSKALEQLHEFEKASDVNTCETFGLKGAIYKRKWEFDGQFKNLVISLKYYSLGTALWKSFLDETTPDFAKKTCDFGYTAINSAFLNELIAVELLEQGDGALTLADVKKYLQDAFNVRTNIIDKLAAKNDSTELEDELKKYLDDNDKQEGVIDKSFIYATLMEAYFGILDFEKAEKLLKKIMGLPDMTRWKTRSTAIQLIAISELQAKICNYLAKETVQENYLEIYQSSDEILKSKNSIITTLLNKGKNNSEKIEEDNKAGLEPQKGKYGIGLSGGGHRAAIYHIGVLASLAENDLLRHLEVLSCVSGGSISGTFYYLCLKKVLQDKDDASITKDDYVNIIKYMQVHFKDGVQENLRSRMFAGLKDNLRMIFTDYSRTHKVGELYEKYFYKKAMEYDPMWSTKINTVTSKNADDLPITMDKLIIVPFGEDKFDIQYDNWKRKNKVPQLVLNATCLNTGHNFQFTATWMGVPPGNMQPDIDVKPRLRRLYYEEAPNDYYRNFRLGYAVAASSCVPAIFKAFPMPGLYQDMKVQLIDGGYHENQGVAALLEQECKNLIISDGSGQLSSINRETPGDLNVFYRADVVVQERVRELEFMDIRNRTYSCQLESISAVHLRKDLTEYPRNWVNCEDPPRRLIYSDFTNLLKETNYNIEKDMQQQISEVRTDLDSFNDTESYMLMYDGYMQMNKEITDLYGVSTGIDPKARENWHFLAMRDIENEEKAKQLMKYSSIHAFKAFHYWKQTNTKLIKIILPLVALLLLVVAWYFYKNALIVFMDGITSLKIIAAALIIVLLIFWEKVLAVLFAFVKAVAFSIHLKTTDKYFIKAGKIDVSKPTETTAVE
ncbi:MAG: patatin-like phospholipase family protein [Ferruginibacter sp.]